MEGYRIPPVMFTEREAYALITIEQLILKHKDASLVKEFTEIVAKIKSVLRNSGKEKIERLEKRMYIGKNYNNESTSRVLIDIQIAIIENRLIKITYCAEDGSETNRTAEPYMLYHSVSDDWTLIAYCRLRNDFRVFRLDRIKQFSIAYESFELKESGFKKFIEKKYMS
jgi:predicted DNA-binding transcriptional regulator YafY